MDSDLDDGKRFDVLVLRWKRVALSAKPLTDATNGAEEALGVTRRACAVDSTAVAPKD